MKKNFLTKFAAVALVMGTVVTALPACASTQYMSQVFTGTSDNNRSDRETLGSGTRYLHATAKAGTGDGQAKKYVANGADKKVATVHVKNVDGKDKDIDSFTADGSSEYYMRWLGNSDKSKARLYIDESK